MSIYRQSIFDIDISNRAISDTFDFVQAVEVLPRVYNFWKFCSSYHVVLLAKIFNTCQIVDAIDERVDAAVENGGEVEDVAQDWVNLGEKGRHTPHPLP